MSLIVTTYLSEGIVMASDSRTTQTISKGSKQIVIPLTDNANKTFLAKNNIGISICGAASYKNGPIAGAINGFINNYAYTGTNVLKFANDFIKMIVSLNLSSIFIAHIAGYENNLIQKGYRVWTDDKNLPHLKLFANGTFQGSSWDGEAETLSRLLKQEILCDDLSMKNNISYTDKKGTVVNVPKGYVLPSNSRFFSEGIVPWDCLSLQDAIDFNRFAIQTTIEYQRFISTTKTVGGPIDILVIRPQNSEWVSKKELK